MASGLYLAFKVAALGALRDCDSSDIRTILTDAGTYTVDLSTHDFLDDIAGGARVSTLASTMTSLAVSNAAFDAAAATHSSVSGASVEAITIYFHTGTESTSGLMAYIDSGTNLPFTPTGGNVTINWDTGTNKIWRWT